MFSNKKNNMRKTIFFFLQYLTIKNKLLILYSEEKKICWRLNITPP